MRKFSGILGILISLVMCFVGVMMTLLTPLADVLPGYLPENVANYAVPTVEVPAEEMVQVKNVEFELPENAMENYDVKIAPSLVGSPSTHSSSYDYLLLYSFGADFYTEMYKASYKIFDQLMSINSGVATLTSGARDIYNAVSRSFTQLTNLSEGIDVLVDRAGQQYQVMATMAQQQAITTNAAAAVNSNLGLVYQAQNAQTTQLNNMAAGLGQLIAMFTLLIRAIGVLIVCLGLMLLCKSFGMLGGFKAIAPKEPKASEPALEAAAE